MSSRLARRSWEKNPVSKKQTKPSEQQKGKEAKPGDGCNGASAAGTAGTYTGGVVSWLICSHSFLTSCGRWLASP